MQAHEKVKKALSRLIIEISLKYLAARLKVPSGR